MIPTAQVAWEFETLLRLAGRPERVLEIGVWHGGTLAQWLRVAEVVVAVDLVEPPLPRRSSGGDLVFMPGDSHDPAIIADVREFGPYDVVFIDADHSSDAVRADWENYRTMVAPGGLVAFHDILPREGYGVSDLWDGIKAEGYRTVEIVGTEPSPWMDDPRAGIGCVFL